MTTTRTILLITRHSRPGYLMSEAPFELGENFEWRELSIVYDR